MKWHLRDIKLFEMEAERQIAEVEAELHAARFSRSIDNSQGNDMHGFYISN